MKDNAGLTKVFTLIFEAVLLLLLGIGVNSVQDLNVKIAVILENMAVHNKLLEDHEVRLRYVETNRRTK